MLDLVPNIVKKFEALDTNTGSIIKVLEAQQKALEEMRGVIIILTKKVKDLERNPK